MALILVPVCSTKGLLALGPSYPCQQRMVSVPPTFPCAVTRVGCEVVPSPAARARPLVACRRRRRLSGCRRQVATALVASESRARVDRMVVIVRLPDGIWSAEQ